MTKLSIITINYNNVEGLRKTIESVVNQTYSDFEYIIIDGASTDGSVDIIKQFADKISYWVSEPDKGIYNAMNKGILKANGEYLLFLNSGDWLYGDNVLKVVFKEYRDEDLIYGDAILIDNKKIIERFIYPECLTAFYLFNWMICHQSIFHKKMLFDKRNYNEQYKIVADWEFLIQAIICNNCTFIKINEIIVYNDATGISSNENAAIEERNKVLAEYFPQKIIDDYMYFSKIAITSKNSSLYPFLDYFSDDVKLQRLIKRLFKGLLYLKGDKNKIPSENRNYYF